jgi:hypothetical protein
MGISVTAILEKSALDHKINKNPTVPMSQVGAGSERK